MVASEGPKLIRYIVLAVLVLLAGIGGFFYWLFTGLYGMDDDFIRINAPGEQRVVLETPGKYTVFWEYFGGKGARFPGRIQMKVFDDRETAIPIAATTLNQTYQFNDRQGVALFQFNIGSPGVYRMETHIQGDESEESVTLSLSRGFMPNLFKVVLGGLAIMFGSVLLAGFLVILGLLRRRASRVNYPPGMPPPVG